jgi:hypothetical protein
MYTPKSKITNGRYMCGKHYSQMLQYGQILTKTKFDKNEIIIKDNFAEVVLYDKANREIARALIDIEDIDKVNKHKWHLSKHGYAVCNSSAIRMHRLIMDVTSDNDQVDHENTKRLDNRKSNLRVCNNQQNSRNKGVSRSNTGFIGVSYQKRDKNYQAHIKVDYEKIYLGTSKIIEEAIKLRLEAEFKYFGKYSPQKHLFEEYGIGGVDSSVQ